MHKFSKVTTFGMFALLALGAVSCGKNANNMNARGMIDLNFWTGFGAAYSNYLTKLIDYQYDTNGINIEHTSQSGYENLQKNINATLNTGDYPNMANGYPDHFAGYAKEDALLDLTEMIKAYDEEHASDEGYIPLEQDYYEQYMKENKELKTDCIMGVPFNKSTELMGYNGVFVDYAKDYFSKKGEEIKIPETWQEWQVYGPKYREVQKSLCGKVLHGKQTEEGTASEFVVNTVTTGDDVLIDLSNVKENECRILSWDSADNMFITIVRDWGSQYTSYTDEDRASPLQQGYIEFASETNKPKTIAALKFFDNLYKGMIFGLPADFNASYSSDAFEQNKVMFMVCSTGGLSYNINAGQRFRCAPLPYYNGEDGIRKYVISQGTNIGIFDQTSPNSSVYDYEATIDIAFKALVDFSTGERQAQWAIDTGYFPASKSAAQTKLYQDFLKEETYDDPIRVAYREGSQVNEKFYMEQEPADGVKWEKFVDPGFDGSSTIRQKVSFVMSSVFSSTEQGDAKYEKVLNETVESLGKFVR